MATPSAGRAIPLAERVQPVASQAAHQDLDSSQLLAAVAVAALGFGSLGAVALMSRRQRGYLARR